MADPGIDPYNGGIRIDPTSAPREPSAVYATFILKNTADARVTQAFCNTTPADRPTSYCGFEITATVPEAPIGASMVFSLILLTLLSWRRLNRMRILFAVGLLFVIASSPSISFAQRRSSTFEFNNAIKSVGNCKNPTTSKLLWDSGNYRFTCGTDQGGGGSDTTTASNLGGGLANFSAEVGDDLRFNSFAAADFDLASNLLTIDATKWLTLSAASAAYQPLDADLTNVAALTTTTGGRSILASTPADDQVYVGDSASAGTWRSIPDCGEAGTLNYTAATNAFSCLTDSSGGGGGNSVEQSIVLSGGAGFFSQAVTGQAWVTTSSEIVCAPLGTTADSLTPEAVAIGGLNVSVSDRSAGVGFTINVFSPYGLEGTVRVHCIGV